MDITATLEKAKEQPNTTLAIPIRRSKSGVKQFYSMFKCQECGRCCTTFFEEIEFGKDEFNLIKKHLPQGGRSKFRKACKLYRTDANPCLFYSKKLGGCKIYKDRPLRCRTYPTGYTTREAPNNLAAHTGCPAACEVIKRAWEMKDLD